MLATQTAAARVVRAVLDGRNLNQVLNELFRNSRFTPQQRGAVQDLSYGTLRFYGRLDAVLRQLLHKPLRDVAVRDVLLVALYQLEYGRAAPYAVVDHAVRAVRKLNAAAGGLANAVLRNFQRQRETLLAEAMRRDEGRYAYPQWWIDLLRAQYGARAEAMLEAGNLHPPMTLRVNRRRTTRADYLARLQQAGIAAEALGESGVLLAQPVGVDKLPGFAEGDVSVQDAGAQLAAPLLDVHDGLRVLDACAAPGGKSAHLLELADIDLTALDHDAQRLERVQENMQRLSLRATLLCGDAGEPEPWWDGRPFDRILADVPCSASGVVRRHPDIKWLRRPDDIARFAEQQARILRALWRLLAKDGKLLYATCSVFALENRQTIETFLREQPDAEVLPLAIPELEEGQCLPDDRHDGFFYALLHKRA
jgi:16S rRNA (cytosine967-C5)-methyltransferase